MTVNKIKLLLQSFLLGSIFYLLKFNFLTCADFLDGPKPGHLNSKTRSITNLQYSPQTRHMATFEFPCLQISFLFLQASRYGVSSPQSGSAIRKKIFYFKI